MKSTFALKLLRTLFLGCLISVTLTACAKQTPTSPPSSLVILKDTSAEVADKVCGGLAPEVLTAEERADVLALNYAARFGKRYQLICKK